MTRLVASILLITLVFCVVASPAWAQAPADPAPVEEAATVEAGTPDADQPAATDDNEEQAKLEEANEPASELPEQLQTIAKDVDNSETAKETSAGILTPIYKVAEALEFPAFHWLAFALMLAGVIGFALQLVIGKLVVMAHLGFSLREILSDVLSFVISLFGLVLTTQAAAQNSTFTQSPFAVLSASLLGLILGIMLYFWGQAQEVEAVKGRTAAAAEARAREKK
ncbi:hypothetical protein C5Y96_06070 [Blastopirellula marina]|uniref:Uncharacterized protein n=1 Tax=Blastopirellula marina TaxID=124 RepID=A0A2S8FX25_9BACT|nr:MULTISPECIES: hypothetical protein [Pirellulaceae]PQO36736.1 hypothetical protein C5Y96_06070 [Blastopirellula marina]RCS53451.1 hypothetical protein DTL36_06080 [Bremerella cremea]